MRVLFRRRAASRQRVSQPRVIFRLAAPWTVAVKFVAITVLSAVTVLVIWACGGSGGSTDPGQTASAGAPSQPTATPVVVDLTAVAREKTMIGQKSFDETFASKSDSGDSASALAAADFIAEFASDSDATVAKYSEPVTVAGIVEKKGRDFRNFAPYLDINGEEASDTHVIRCNLQTISERSRQRGVRDEDPTENFEPGDPVTVVGTLKLIPTAAIGKVQVFLSPCQLAEN